MQFELVDQLIALRDDRLILRRVDAPEAAREHVLGGLADQRRLSSFWPQRRASVRLTIA